MNRRDRILQMSLQNSENKTCNEAVSQSSIIVREEEDDQRKENIPIQTYDDKDTPSTVKQNIAPTAAVHTTDRSSPSSSSESSSTSCSDLEDSDDSVKDPDFVETQLKPKFIPDSDGASSDSSFGSIIPGTPDCTSLSIPTASTSTLSVGQENQIATPCDKTKKTRKRVAKPSEWRQNKAKLLRSAGLSYTNTKNVEKRARWVKPACGGKCRLKCAQKISEEDRQNIFRSYWDLQDINRQRDMISSNMSSINRKYRYTMTQKGRNLNNAFYFTLNENKIRVCKTFFINTLDINNRVIQTVIAKRTPMNTVTKDMRGNHSNHRKLPVGVKEGVRKHIESIPRIESHYLRQQTSRQFIDGGKTITDLHNDYKLECIKNDQPYANYVMYAKIFNTEYNLGFFVPKKDRCELCVAYENAEGEDKEKLKQRYLQHLKEKELSREEKMNDKDSDKIVLVYDLQAVLQLPKGEVSVFYYKSKINCLNFTITDLKSKKTDCYFWHEAEARRGADEIGSCVFKYVEKVTSSYSDDKKLDLVFYSDNCCGQNKNQFIVALYQYCILKFKNLNSIEHKFLISGHTQNEGDAVHSVIEKSIERNLKSGPIYVPSQYVQIIKSAKKSGEPYTVNEMSHKDFMSIRSLATDLKINIANIKITEVKVIKLLASSPGFLYYKKSYEDEDYTEFKLWRKPPALPSVQLAYSSPITLSENKKTDLMSLIRCNHIPKFYESFYKSIFE